MSGKIFRVDFGFVKFFTFIDGLAFLNYNVTYLCYVRMKIFYYMPILNIDFNTYLSTQHLGKYKLVISL